MKDSRNPVPLQGGPRRRSELPESRFGGEAGTLTGEWWAGFLLHDQTPGDDLVTTYDTLTTPAHPLSIFKAKDPDGTWQLWVVDEGTGGVGTVNDWSLEITTVTP